MMSVIGGVTVMVMSHHKPSSVRFSPLRFISNTELETSVLRALSTGTNLVGTGDMKDRYREGQTGPCPQATIERA